MSDGIRQEAAEKDSLEWVLLPSLTLPAKSGPRPSKWTTICCFLLSLGLHASALGIVACISSFMPYEPPRFGISAGGGGPGGEPGGDGITFEGSFGAQSFGDELPAKFEHLVALTITPPAAPSPTHLEKAPAVVELHQPATPPENVLSEKQADSLAEKVLPITKAIPTEEPMPVSPSETFPTLKRTAPELSPLDLVESAPQLPLTPPDHAPEKPSDSGDLKADVVNRSSAGVATDKREVEQVGDGSAGGGPPMPVPGGKAGGPGRGTGRGGGGGGMNGASALISNPLPPYPPGAVARGVEGLVLLRVWIRDDGSVEKVEVLQSSGDSSLDESALSTVRDRWQFVPARRGGVNVPSRVRLPIRFQLHDRN